MLRITRCLVDYPSKTVIEDLATRDGEPNEFSWSPFVGKQSELNKQFSGTQQSRFKLNEFLQFVRNRDLDPARINEAKKYGMLEEAVSTNAGYKILEDMVKDGSESPGVLKYFVDMCVGFKKDRESPYNKNRDFYTRVVRNLDGDDDAVEEKYLINREDDTITNEEYEQTIREVPYLIKSIWSYSKQYQGNIFSFLFAYADIVEKRNGNKNVNIQDFRNYKTYCINKDGTFKKQFSHADDNKYTIYPKLTKIFIAPGSHQNVYNACMKFLNALKILGINFRDEDPLQFDNDYVNRLICTYLPNNEEYIQEYKGIDPEIIIALKPENIFSTIKSAVYVPKSNKKGEYDYNQLIYIISERLDMAYKLNWESSDLLDEKEDVALEILIEYFKTRSGDDSLNTAVITNSVAFHPSTGILYIKKLDGKRVRNSSFEYLTLDGKYFGTFKGMEDYKVIFTKYGFIVALDEDYDNIYYLRAEECLRVLEAYNETKTVQDEADWKCL